MGLDPLLHVVGRDVSLSVPAYSRVQNSIPLLRSTPRRSAAGNTWPQAGSRSRALAWSSIRKTPSHRPNLRPRPDVSDLVQTQAPSRWPLEAAIHPCRATTFL